MKLVLSLFAGLCAFVLSGCVIVIDNDDDEYADVDMEISGDCRADEYQGFVGKPVAAVSLPDDQKVRLIRPGTAVTMDYRDDRMNVKLDDRDVITRIYCG